MRIAYPPELPVSARREDLLAAIRDHQVVVVAGETGSGKSTQLPKLCLELGRTAIAHTQPRRLAARTLAERIAEELGVGLGTTVGYAVRFDDRTADDTRVKLVTDGLLLAEIGRDRLLRRYDTVIVDEAHERSLNVDFLLGYLKSILPRRPDLKVLITSATIDPQRFADHFGGAPVIEVSGRTYPVTTRYRPLEPEDDLADAIGDAVEDLPGDVLVFLSGEREIRDTAEALQGRLRGVEVLPLYARLAAAEQQRVFKPTGAAKRVILATNVAETSLTVPGIRSVVDPGTARISRYSARLKVQRLPIEPISQASADQRRGRCGRVAEGVCVRLYDEDDFAQRPRFTDPEILRTNLASVLLQMAALGLGEVEEVPFLDPPDARQVRDGRNLLVELGAFAGDGRLTPLGRKLARLPVDPRMGRMILEAGARGCASEVIVIAAGLTIVDPRERPRDARAEADALHARFADDSSDFLAYLNLWRHLREQQRALSGNQFRKRLRAEHLHYLRVREWQDLNGQLRAAARGAGLRLNREDADPVDVHRSLLAGLLSHIGLRDDSSGGPASAGRGASVRPRHPRGREYLGARGARFAIFPGSALARKQPEWVMAAELVETSRLWARELARIDPRWIEPLAGHLVRRDRVEPRWDARRAQVVATERVTLYGLPIGSRTVPFPDRATFIQKALVEGEWEARHAFIAENRHRVAEVEAEEERARRRGLLVADAVLFDFFAARVPEHVVSGRTFDRWHRDQDPELLVFPRDLLRTGGGDTAGRPGTWRQGGHELRLTYRFEPGAPDDGVTVHVPLALLGELRDVGFDWLVPALREELVTALIRGLPKDKRRPFAPVPEVARRVTGSLRPRKGPIVAQVAERLGLEPGDFDTGALPPHLRMKFAVEDAEGAVLAYGDDLGALRAQVRPQLRARLAGTGIERSGLRGFAAVPRRVELAGIAGYPALVDEGSTVGVRVFEDEAAAEAAQRTALARLLRRPLPPPSDLIFATAEPELLEDLARAVAEALAEPVWDEEGWQRLRAHAAGRWDALARSTQAQVAEVLRAAADVRAAMARRGGDALRETRLDVARQLGRLLHPGWVSAAGVDRVEDVARYLRAAERRLERAPDALAADRDHMATLRELEAQARDEEARWLLEELRVSYFAPALAREKVSARRVRAALASNTA